MPVPQDDDLFKDSTMTFGEHLEELRSSLIKALLALALGFLFGMLVGRSIVDAITHPLRAALQAHYSQSAVEDYKQRLELRKQQGEAIPPELLDDANIRAVVTGQQLLFDEVYVQPTEVLRELKKMYPGKFDDVELPAINADTPLARENMLRMFLWHTFQDDRRLRVVSMNAQEGFVVWLKASFVAGAVFSSPFVFWFLWSFVAAGLYPHEKRYVHIFLPFSLGLFLAGVATAYFVAFPFVLSFFFSYNAWLGIDLELRLSEWLSFVLLMPLGFGVSFQMPLVMLFLERIGIFSVASYLSKWRMAVLVIAVVSMVLSPGGDPYSMMLMFIPLTMLYFGGILLCKFMPSPSGVRRPRR